MVLKHYLRGSILILSALVASSVFVTIAIKRALTIVDRINSGEIPIDTGAISKLVSDSASGADGLTANIFVIVFGVCWLIGVLDSYRLGSVRENKLCE